MSLSTAFTNLGGTVGALIASYLLWVMVGG
jgi:hypothetical protein